MALILYSYAARARVRALRDRIPPRLRPAEDLGWLSELWQDRYPGTPPVGHLVRTSPRWVRFHGLPESKRYADTPAEHAELLRRHHAVLRSLAAPDAPLLAVTASWSPTAYVRKRSNELAAAAPDAKLWRSLVLEPDDEDAWYTNVFVSRLENNPRSLDSLLTLVAEYRTADVILTTAGLDWLYHPYDGGGEVVAPTLERRDALARQFADWLPTEPHGL